MLPHFSRKPGTVSFATLLLFTLTVSATLAAPIVPLSAVSRKVHGAAGAFDVLLPLTGSAGIECRSGGSAGDHQVVLTFAAPVTCASASVATGIGSVSSASANGSQITVNLTNVTNPQKMTVKTERRK